MKGCGVGGGKGRGARQTSRQKRQCANRIQGGRTLCIHAAVKHLWSVGSVWDAVSCSTVQGLGTGTQPLLGNSPAPSPPSLSAAACCQVPLRVQAGGITLPGCSTSKSVCSSNTTAAAAAEDGLAQALQQALAAAASTASTAAAGAAGAGLTVTAQGLVLPQLKQELLKQQQQQLAGVAEGGDVAGEEGPLSTGFSRVGAVPQQQQQQQGEEGCDGEASGCAVSWLHTPDDPQQKQLQQQQQQQQRLDLVGMPTVGVAARGAAVSKHLGARLAQLSQTQEEVSGQLQHPVQLSVCHSPPPWPSAHNLATFCGICGYADSECCHAWCCCVEALGGAARSALTDTGRGEWMSTAIPPPPPPPPPPLAKCTCCRQLASQKLHPATPRENCTGSAHRRSISLPCLLAACLWPGKCAVSIHACTVHLDT